MMNGYIFYIIQYKFTTIYKIIMAIHKNIDYKAAGVIFTNNTHIIAGFQQDEQANVCAFSGIGGKKEISDEEIPKFTAIREMLEELFDIQVNLLDINIKKQAKSNIELLEQMIFDLDNMRNIDINIHMDIKSHLNYLIQINQSSTIYSDEQVEQNKLKVNNLINQIILIPVDKYIYHNSYVNFIYDFTQLEEILHIIKNNNFTSKYYHDFPTNIIDLIAKRKRSSGEIKSLALLPLQENLQVHEYFIQDIKEIVSPTTHTF
jgi:hypothetical protein